jgi:ATP phosphoribosyltransferase regulatory subunit
MHRWLLPEAIEDVLPREARKLEALRRSLLDAFRLRGYDLVIPPLLEYLDSLLIGSGSDLNLRTFKLVDQLSGRTLGIRADITPQVARMDAHLLNREGVTRLCYFGSVLHALPSGFTSTREPLQIGAEIYGHGGLEADMEIIRLLGESLSLSGVKATRLDLGHVGVFKALVDLGGIAGELEQELLASLQAKDIPSLKALVEDVREPFYSALLVLPELYGSVEVLDRAQAILPHDPRIRAALDDLRALAAGLKGLPVSFDLSDLRGYHYHSGIVFAAYCAGHPGAIALGGRYDEVGRAFGRGRPATGFSMDMREILRLLPLASEAGSILAPLAGEGLEIAVTELRQAGETVVPALPGHEGTWTEAGCDRQLVRRDGLWVVVALGDGV